MPRVNLLLWPNRNIEKEKGKTINTFMTFIMHGLCSLENPTPSIFLTLATHNWHFSLLRKNELGTREENGCPHFPT